MPMNKPRLTRTRIILAFAVALIADLVQLPITAVEETGAFFVPGEIADFVVDCVAMAATTALLGFHWALLPSLLLEAIPGLDLLPTWTGCVAFVVWQRKKEQRAPGPTPPVPTPELPDQPKLKALGGPFGEPDGSGQQAERSSPPRITYGDTDSR